ncbi:MAG: DNA repair protein RecO [Bacteroidetes bacterium]|nr:DNA repair protein RecO [Bacteroidota bacterium]MBU1677879.1 DNA repair protein RecO [Bacteroidota bacterium]MBU2505931.1 DNA repair protein RecO [Bacteroidota bacterium]
MTEIVKTEALVLRKINYGDTSKIVTLFTENHGKVSAIIKGGRSNKSKIGSMMDVCNHVQVIYYLKESRDIQLVTQADLISYYPQIKGNLESLKYAMAAAELLSALTYENEPHKKMFKGVVRILNLIEKKTTDSQFLFVKFFIFFLEEIGYGIHGAQCSMCGTKLSDVKKVFYNSASGFNCDDCGKRESALFEFSSELFKKFVCLSNRNFEYSISEIELNRIIVFLEKYLKNQIEEFKGIKSLRMY